MLTISGADDKRNFIDHNPGDLKKFFKQRNTFLSEILYGPTIWETNLKKKKPIKAAFYSVSVFEKLKFIIFTVKLFWWTQTLSSGRLGQICFVYCPVSKKKKPDSQRLAVTNKSLSFF